MSGDRAQEARAVAGSLAAALRQQQELGVTGVPVPLARRLHDWLSEAPAALGRATADAIAEAPSTSVATPAVDDARAASARAIERRTSPSPRGARPPYARRGEDAPRVGVGSPALEAIRQELGDCERCGLCERRTNIVFGVGNPNARLMFVGEAPGETEDRRGEPFVGAAGELLTKMIGAMGLSREQIYIANVVKCRPPGNRDPTAAEVAKCLPFLRQQVAAVAPEIIVTLGRVAPEALLAREVKITKERGTWTEFEGVPTLLTLHPAYLLRHAAAKRDAWSDLQQVMKHLGLERQ